MALLQEWLTATASVNGNFGHLLLEQQAAPGAHLIAALRAYFESAHQDARDLFHTFAGIDLHPDADGEDAAIQYPRSLPAIQLHGLFGEVLAGLVTQSYQFVNNRAWIVPIFLFRHHDAAKAYLYELRQNPGNGRGMYGRFGSDFIAIELDQNGSVARYLVGEAKWRNIVQPSLLNDIMLGPQVNGVRDGSGIWGDLNRANTMPYSLRQLQALLGMYAPEEYAAAILSIDQAISQRAPLTRADYVIVAGGPAARREPGTALLPTDQAPAEYTAGRDLQLVEVLIPDGAALITSLYNALWTAVEDQDAAA